MAKLTRIVRCGLCNQPLSDNDRNNCLHREIEPTCEKCLTERIVKDVMAASKLAKESGHIADTIVVPFGSNAAKALGRLIQLDEGVGGVTGGAYGRTVEAQFDVDYPTGVPGEIEVGQRLNLAPIGDCIVTAKTTTHSNSAFKKSTITVRRVEPVAPSGPDWTANPW